MKQISLLLNRLGWGELLFIRREKGFVNWVDIFCFWLFGVVGVWSGGWYGNHG